MASTARIEELRKKYEENQRRYFAPLANEYRKAGQLEEAIALCRAWLPQQPGHMSGHIVFGQTLFEAGELPEARTVFETALDLDPENLIALRHLGDIARRHGEVESARSWYRRVLDADPRNDEISALMMQLDSLSHPATEPVHPEDAEIGVLAVEFEADLAGASMSAEAAAWSGTPDAGDAAPAYPQGADSDDAATSGAAAADPAASGSDIASIADNAARDAAAALFDDPPSGGREEAAQASLEMDVRLSGVEGSFDALVSSEPDAESAARAYGEEPGTGMEPAAAGAAASQGNDETAGSGDPGDLSSAGAGTLADSFLASSGESGDVPVHSATASVQNDIAADSVANELGLEVMEFIPPPRNATRAPTADTNPLEGHFLADASVATGTPQAFVTETMAELYLRQGFRDEALGVYRQLLQQSPGDEALRDRVAQLEKGSSSSLGMAAISDEVIESARRRQTAHTPPSMRAFLGRLAGRRAPRREVAPDEAETPAPAEPQQEAADPGSALDFGEQPDAGLADWTAEPEQAGTAVDSEGDGNFPSLSEFGTPAAHDDSQETGAGEPATLSAGPGDSEQAVEPVQSHAEVGQAEAGTLSDDASSVDTASDAAPSPGRASGDAPSDRGPQAGGSMGGLFSGAVIQAGDEAAATTLAAAFAPQAEKPDSKLLGRPTRAAKNEISLDHVFRESGSRPATPRERTNFSFDQFFSEGASSPAKGGGEPAGTPADDDAPTDDIEQFNSWLEGLKKK